jgi:hypothetical protein
VRSDAEEAKEFSTAYHTTVKPAGSAMRHQHPWELFLTHGTTKSNQPRTALADHIRVVDVAIQQLAA